MNMRRCHKQVVQYTSSCRLHSGAAIFASYFIFCIMNIRLRYECRKKICTILYWDSIWHGGEIISWLVKITHFWLLHGMDAKTMDLTSVCGPGQRYRRYVVTVLFGCWYRWLLGCPFEYGCWLIFSQATSHSKSTSHRTIRSNRIYYV